MDTPQQQEWKSIYTIVLVANVAYVIFFYFLMNTFS